MTTLRQSVLIYDLGATINRIHLHGWDGELDLLMPEQLKIYADATGQAIEPQGPNDAASQAHS